MKEKVYFHNISHVIVSFCFFILTGRAAAFLMGQIAEFDAATTEIFPFILAAVCTLLVFRLFKTIIPPPDGTEDALPVMAGRFRKRPFSMKRYVLETIPHTFITVSLLILVMYLVTIAFTSDGALINASRYSDSILAFLSMIVIHPLAEEYIFRGLYYGKLRSMSPIFACLMQAVMFAISHNGVGGMMYALIAGIILGTAAERSNGITVPVAAHMMINLRTFLYNEWLPDSLCFSIDLAVMAAGAISFGIVCLVLKKLPSYENSKKPPSTREEADFDD